MWSIHVRLIGTAAAVLALSAGSAFAEEKRCTELGESCVCSEPLNTATYNPVFDWGWNPADSVTRECGLGTAGVAISRNSRDIVGTNDSAILGALPAGNMIQHVMRAATGHVGIFDVGHNMGSDRRFVQRLAVRFYRYYSPDISLASGPNFYNGDSTGEDFTCGQSVKLLEYAVPGLTSSRYQWYPQANNYNFLDFTPPLDCCSAQNEYPGAYNKMVGRWWRFEAVFVNRGGPNFSTKLYARNITDNLPEQLIWDWEASRAKDTEPPGRIDNFSANNYRQEKDDSNAPCSGYYATTHFMVAGWDTDAEQRIGAASEVEGNATGNPDAGTSPESDRSAGCGCRTAGAGTSGASTMGLLIGAFLMAWRRRAPTTRVAGGGGRIL